MTLQDDAYNHRKLDSVIVNEKMRLFKGMVDTFVLHELFPGYGPKQVE